MGVKGRGMREREYGGFEGDRDGKREGLRGSRVVMK